MNIFVGNLAFKAREGDVYKLFMPFGSVAYVSIVMDKKGRESRGFAFLEMPDEQQALAAIAALHHKEFMGRPINVEPARPKPEASRDSRKRESEAGNQDRYLVPERTGAYRAGRRTRSFMKKRAQAGIKEAVPHKQHKKNPMAWPKKYSRPKPWQKDRGEQKEADGEAKPWKKSPGTAKPWVKGEGRGKPGSYKERKGRL